MASNGSPDHTITISLRLLDSRTYTLRVNRHATVGMLKQHIAGRIQIPVPNQHLLYGGRALSDECPLSSYNIQDGHAIHLVIRQQPSHAPSPSTTPQFWSVPPAAPAPARTQRPSTSAFAMGGPTLIDDEEVVHRIIRSLIASLTVTATANSSVAPGVIDAMTRLLLEVDLLNRLYQTNGYNHSAARPNPHQRVPRTPEALASLFLGTRTLLNNALGRMQSLAWELQRQLSVADFNHRWDIQWLAWTVGTQLQDVGTLLLELGRLTSILRVEPDDNTLPRAVVTSSPPVFLDQFRPNPGLGFQVRQPRYRSQRRRRQRSSGAGTGARARAGAIPNTGPRTSTAGNQVPGAITPDPSASGDEAANEGRP